LSHAAEILPSALDGDDFEDCAPEPALPDVLSARFSPDSALGGRVWPSLDGIGPPACLAGTPPPPRPASIGVLFQVFRI
jgi:hypothetical protein